MSEDKKEDRELVSKISWHDYFFSIMDSASARSKDPNTKVGAVIVNQDNKIIGIGYNGFPSGFRDLEQRWNRPKKYDYVVHAEMNAILNTTCCLRQAKIYLPFWPCKECAKYIAASGINEIHVRSDYYKNSISVEIFNECNISIIKH